MTVTKKAWLLPALLALGLWSSLAALGTRLTHVPPFLLLGVTLLIGSLLALPRWRNWLVSPSILLFGVAGIFGYHFLIFMALRLAPPVEANLLNYLWPTLIVLLSSVLLKGYRLNAGHVSGALAAFTGAALVVTGGTARFQSQYWKGYALATGAAVVWSSYSVLTKRIKAFPNSGVGGFCFFSGVLALGCHFAFEQGATLSSNDWVALTLLGVGPMGIAFYAWDRALRLGDPRVVGALSYFTPLASTALLALSGGGRLTPAVVGGMVLIVIGALAGTAASLRR